MEAVVVKPRGSGSFPAVIILHGSTGFQQEYVELAQSMAQAGFVGVAACWFEDGRRESDTRYTHPRNCAGGPKMPDPRSTEAARSVGALLNAVRAAAYVASDRVALFGHSRGAAAALNYIISDGSLARAIVLNSGGYPSEVTAQISKISVPILMLHGTGDAPSNGGIPATDVKLAREFEGALRGSGKTVDAKYYEGAGHSEIFRSAVQREDEMRRTADFLRQYLRN